MLASDQLPQKIQVLSDRVAGDLDARMTIRLGDQSMASVVS